MTKSFLFIFASKVKIDIVKNSRLRAPHSPLWSLHLWTSSETSAGRTATQCWSPWQQQLWKLYERWWDLQLFKLVGSRLSRQSWRFAELLKYRGDPHSLPLFIHLQRPPNNPHPTSYVWHFPTPSLSHLSHMNDEGSPHCPHTFRYLSPAWLQTLMKTKMSTVLICKHYSSNFKKKCTDGVLHQSKTRQTKLRL